MLCIDFIVGVSCVSSHQLDYRITVTGISVPQMAPHGQGRKERERGREGGRERERERERVPNKHHAHTIIQ